MKRPIQLKGGKTILDAAHIIGVFERNDIDPVAHDISLEIEVILEYNGRTFSQFLTYDTEESRQYEMNKLVSALPDCD
jgi:hypothetical protein